MTTTNAKPVLDDVDAEVKRHKKLRFVTASVYITATCVAITASAVAAILAAFGYGDAAAVSAGTATILMGIEKALLTREKWRVHLSVITALKNVRLKLVAGALKPAEAAEVVCGIRMGYAGELPIGDRDG